MSTPTPEELDARKKRTMWLIAGGVVSLILPLAGVAYLKISESRGSHGPNGNVAFERREAGERKVEASQTVVINNNMNPAAVNMGPGSPGMGSSAGAPMAPAGGSIGFVKGSNEYFQDKKETPAPAAAAPAAPAAPAPAPEPEPAKKTAKKGGKKDFFIPHLQGTKSMAGSGFKSSNQGGTMSNRPTGGAGMQGVAAPAGAGGGDMSELLKNVPGGADNPEVKKYLQNQGK